MNNLSSSHMTGASQLSAPISGNDDTIITVIDRQQEQFATTDVSSSSSSSSFVIEESSVFATNHQSFKNLWPKRGKQANKGKENNDNNKWTLQCNNKEQENKNEEEDEEDDGDEDGDEDKLTRVKRNDRCESCGQSVDSSVGVLFSIESKRKNFKMQTTRKSIGDTNIKTNSLDSKLSGNKKWHLECFR